MRVFKAEHAFSRLTPGGRVVQAEGMTGRGCESRHWPGDGRSERFGWSWRMNWWEEVTMESLAEAGTIQAQKAVVWDKQAEKFLFLSPSSPFFWSNALFHFANIHISI